MGRLTVGLDTVQPEVPRPMAFVRVTLYLTSEQHRLVKAEAARRGMSMSAVIRELLDQKMPAYPADAETATRRRPSTRRLPR